jgi:hypothetical protein
MIADATLDRRTDHDGRGRDGEREIPRSLSRLVPAAVSQCK